ncbi:MAG: hypothetical protein JJU28_08130 [Cyclobacteriaceae bacterium]|nr:hypothetical protein [Cyclobacteriaceae bacterium]
MNFIDNLPEADRPAYHPGDLLNLFITKRGIDRASADVGFMFTAYNLKRIFNLIDKKALRAYLRMLIPCFYRNMASMKAH